MYAITITHFCLIIDTTIVVSIIRQKCVIVIASIIHFLSIVPSSACMCIHTVVYARVRAEQTTCG